MASLRPPRWLRLLVCWELWTLPVSLTASLATTTPLSLDLGVVTLSQPSFVTVGTLALVVARDTVEPIRVLPALCWAVGTATLVGIVVTLSPVAIQGSDALATGVAAAVVCYPLVYTVDYGALVTRSDSARPGEAGASED